MQCSACAMLLPEGVANCPGCREPVMPPIRAEAKATSYLATPDTATPGVAASELLPMAPTVRACYAHAWRQFREHFLGLLLVGFVFFILWVVGAVLDGSASSSQATSPFAESSAATLLSSTPIGASVDLADGIIRFLFASGSRRSPLGLVWYKMLVLWPASYGLQLAFLRAARGEKPQVRDLLDTYSRWQSAVSILAVAAVLALASLPSILLGEVSQSLNPAGELSLLGILAFVLGIPCFVIGLRLLFVPFVIVDEPIGPIAAIRESWRLTSGYGWTIFWAWLLTFPVALLGLLLLIVGIIPAVILSTLVYPSLYLAMSANPKTARAQPGEAAPASA